MMIVECDLPYGLTTREGLVLLDGSTGELRAWRYEDRATGLYSDWSEEVRGTIPIKLHINGPDENKTWTVEVNYSHSGVRCLLSKIEGISHTSHQYELESWNDLLNHVDVFTASNIKVFHE